MTSVRWWRIGAVRILAICAFAIGVRGISYNLDNHTLWNLSHLSGPTSIFMILIGLAIFILGFRVERNDEKISDLSNS